MQSALYTGQIYHSRLHPKKHQFSYQVFMLWLDLHHLSDTVNAVRGLSSSGFAPVQFKRSDFLGDPDIPLEDAVVAKMSELAVTPLHGKVFLLSPLRTFGLYFSPVNFYYLQQDSGHFSHLLAEVSNTPWNERHCYLVDLTRQQDSQKVFHVSPFNPLDMQYKWAISAPAEELNVTLSCSQQTTHFVAQLKLTRQALNSTSLTRVLLRIPSITIKTVVGIYWQALKLWLKGLPIYSHPAQGKK